MIKDCQTKKPPHPKGSAKKDSAKLNVVSVKLTKIDPSVAIPTYMMTDAAGADIKPSISGTI